MIDTNSNDRIGTVLARLLEAVAELEAEDRERRRRGAAPVGRTRLDLSADEGTVGRPVGGPGSTDDGADSADPIADVRYGDEEVLVVADLPGATDGDVSVEFDRDAGALVVHRGEAVDDRVSLRERGLRVDDVTVNNGVLDVRLRREGGTTGDSDGTSGDAE